MVLVFWSFFMTKQSETENNLSSLEDYEEYQSRVDEINQKILELNEYSEFAKSELDTKHKELLFLYQLINEKVKEIDAEKLDYRMPEPKMIDVKMGIKADADDDRANYHANNHSENHNKRILDLSEQGYPIAEIAKMLDIGQGQVKLVLNLYK